MIKRLLAVLICLVMVLGIFMPVSAELILAEYVYDTTAGCFAKTGKWDASPGLKGHDGTRTIYSYEAGGEVFWKPEILGEGKYRILVWNTVHESNAPELKGEVTDKNGTHSFTLNHKEGEAGFVSVGEFELEAGIKSVIKIFAAEKSYARVNSIKLQQLTGQALGESFPQPGEKVDYPDYATRAIPKKDVVIPETKENAVKIYVESGANGDGSEAAPFGTIKEAQAKVRELIKNGYPEGGIGVYLRGGNYLLDETLTFTAEDSGTKESPVIWQSYPGERATLTSAQVINASDFKLVEDDATLKRIPNDGKGKVYYYDLSDMGVEKIEQMDFAKPYLLTIGDEAGTIARWPNEGYGKTGSIFDTCARGDFSERKKGFTYNIIDAHTIKWEAAENLLMYGYWLTPYDFVGTQVAEVNSDAMSFSSKKYSIYGAYGNSRYYAFNLLEEIDRAGEWYLNTDNRILYLYPTEGWEDKEVSIAYQQGDLVNFADASNIILRDLKYTGAGGNGVNMSPDSRNCGIIGGEIINVSGNGAAIDGNENYIRDCDISFTGQSGINIRGGDKYKLIPCGNYIENNKIHDVGQSGSSRTGVQYSGCGLRMSNNHVYNTPHRGFSGSGLEHIIEYNVVERTNMDMNDTGAIYYGDLGMGYGTVIRYNLVRDAVGLPATDTHGEGSMGIYIDQVTGGVDVYGNLVYNMVENALFNNAGRYNKWHNNIAIACAEPLVNCPSYAERTTKMVYDNMMQFDITSETFLSKYPMLEGTVDDELGYSKYVEIYNNVNFACGPNQLAGILEKGGRIENILEFNEMPDCDYTTFLDLDYTEIKKQIPDFEELPIAEMGIYTGGARKDTETIVFDNRAEGFDITYPADGAVDVDPVASLKWMQGVGGIKNYTVYISKDEEFKNIEYIKTTDTGILDIELDYGQTYYWRVKSAPLLGYEGRWNSNGTFKFTTMSFEDRMEKEILSVKYLLENTEEGTEGKQYVQGSKAALETVLNDVSSKAPSKESLSALIAAKDVYLKNMIADKDDLAIAIYDDFQLDAIDDRPMNLYLRSGYLQDAHVQADPWDSKNHVVRFNDRETQYQHGERFFAPQEGYVEASLDIMASQKGAFGAFSVIKSDYYIYDNGPINGAAAKVVFSNDGNIYTGYNNSIKLMPYEENKWYTVKCIVDVKNGKYDVLIDNELKAENVPFGNKNVKRVGMVCFDTLGPEATTETRESMGQFLIDNMIVKTPASYGRNSYLKDIIVNGEAIMSFDPAIDLYRLDMTAEELKSAKIEPVTGANAKTRIWELDGKKAITVMDADQTDIHTYILIAK